MFLERKIAAVMHGEKERQFQAIGMFFCACLLSVVKWCILTCRRLENIARLCMCVFQWCLMVVIVFCRLRGLAVIIH